MEIIRAGMDDTNMFSKEQLAHGACCFYTADKSIRYYFEIQGHEAILYAYEQKYINEVIDEFLFYSNFVTCIKHTNGHVLKQRDAIKLEPFAILKIQPSQFYINEQKLINCKSWIKSQEDIRIPVATIDGKVVSLDGHTRLRAALDLGYTHAYIYPDDCGDYTAAFVNEAINRNIFGIFDMAILPNDEYKVRWDKFCDYFLASCTK